MISMRRSPRLTLVGLFTAAFPLALFACGTSGGGGPVQGVPQYFVMPVQSTDPLHPGVLPAINDDGPTPIHVGDAECQNDPRFEFVLVDDFEAGKAYKSYTYNDSTGVVLPYVKEAKEWEPAATEIPAAWGGDRCGSKQAMHFAGHYADWGAGYGTVLDNHTDTLTGVPFKLIEPYWPGDSIYIPGLAGADLSAWDGITFWARRSRFAGPGFRPGILDRSTADDFNKHLPPEKAACRSIYTLCSCQNTKPCTFWDPAAAGTLSAAAYVPDVAGTYCWDPSIEPYPSGDPTLRCGQTACDFRVDTPIPTMIYNPVSADASALWRTVGSTGRPGVNTMTCSAEPYVFKDSTTPSGKYCYRPGIDADPAEKADRCQDGFLSGTLLDTDWKRYMIPFADLRQGNVDKRSAAVDLASVEALVFAFPGGNLDVWIDDVGFYRKKK